MPRGCESSDEDDYDFYDFGYSELMSSRKIESESRSLPEVQSQEFKEKLTSALEESQLLELLSNAVEQGDTAAVETLIAHGVDVDGSGPQEWTPLMKACVMGKFEMVEFLLQHGSDPNKHKKLFTPLMACCTHTLVAEELKLNCVRLLLQGGADVNARDKYSTTALMFATGSGYKDIVNELLQVPGVNVNVQDREGWTALFYAVCHSNAYLVEKLLSAGTDLKLKDRCNRTAVNLALDKDLKEIAQILGYEEEVYPEPQSRDVSLRALFLEQLPDSEGKGGFSADAQSILSAFKNTRLKEISLPDLLNATNRDLYEIGVKVQAERFKILSEGIHRFHLEPWKKTSIQELTQGVPLSLESVIAIMGTIARHLTVVNASLRYLNTRISTRKRKDPEEHSVERDTVFVLVNAYVVAEKLKVLLPKIHNRVEQIKSDISPDYIYPKAKENHSKKCKYFWYAVGAAATAGLLIVYYKKTPNFEVYDYY